MSLSAPVKNMAARGSVFEPGEFDTIWRSLDHCSLKGERDFIYLLSSSPRTIWRIGEWLLEKYQKHLRGYVGPQFWMHFLQYKSVSEESLTTDHEQDSHAVLLAAVQELFNSVMSYGPALNVLMSLKEKGLLRNVCLKQRFAEVTRAVVFATVPEYFKRIVTSFYRRAFKAYMVVYNKQEHAKSNHKEDSLVCLGCNKECEECGCTQILACFAHLNSKLHSLGVLARVAEDAFLTVIHQEIKNKIEEKCKGEFEANFVGSLLEWLNTELCGWLQIIFQETGKGQESVQVETQEIWEPRLQYFMFKTYADLRIEELFSIIVEYPDSLPALEDLKECLEVTDERNELIDSLRTVFEKRLLHPGANTSDILTQYVSAIRALHVLDPAGIILDNVCEPVKQYLRTREDTVRCIVTSLTDENNTELAEELMHGEPWPVDNLDASDSEDDADNWMPNPSDANSAKPSRSRKAPDIISMLVNIYGSKDLFVSEYRTLLADRILSTFNYDTERELRYLELLKLRFGESHLHFCEIMLKDIADSRRINTHIQSSGSKEARSEPLDLSAMILSAVFWPTFKEEKLKVPDEVEMAMAEYTKSFEALKGMRSLQWKPHLGLVELELELQDRTLTMVVTPVQATTIMHFQERESWPLDELSSVMHVPPGMLRRRLGFWVSQGVLKEDAADTFVIVEKQKGPHRTQDLVVEAEVESVTTSPQDQREEELQVFWAYIVGMLTNLESLPLERIHSMLRMFAMEGPSSSQCSVEDLRRFLDRKVKEQELQFVNGFYRLPRCGR